MDKRIRIFSFFILFLFMLSMELWIGWNGRKSLMFALFACGALVVKNIYKIPFSFSKRNVILILLFYIAFLYRLNGGIVQIFTQIPSQLIPMVCIVCIKDEYKEKVLYYITKWYSRIIFFSLLTFVFVYFLPFSGFGSLEFALDSNYGVFTNYILYVERINTLTGSFPRFNGPFLEPGYVGMIGAFLIYANNFNFKKKENRIILFSVLASMSLAGWLLLIIGYMLNVFYKGGISVAKLVVYLLLVVSLIQFAQHYNNGDNVVNEKILSRLEYDKEKGFSGNNRNSETIQLLAIGMWASDFETLLLGYDENFFYQFDEWELVGSGFDNFLVHHGLIGVLLVFSFYVFIIKTALNKKFALLFFIFILFCFWQRSYALWFSWIICFYYSSVIADRYKYINK